MITETDYFAEEYIEIMDAIVPQMVILGHSLVNPCHVTFDGTVIIWIGE